MNDAPDQNPGLQVWQVRRVRAALDAAEAGYVTPHDDVVADFVHGGLFTQEEYSAEMAEARAKMGWLHD